MSTAPPARPPAPRPAPPRATIDLGRYRALVDVVATLTTELGNVTGAVAETAPGRAAAEAELAELRPLLDQLRARTAELELERDRYREHSVLLNTVGWRAAEALGLVAAGQDLEDGPGAEELIGQLIAERDRWRDRAEALADAIPAPVPVAGRRRLEPAEPEPAGDHAEGPPAGE